MSYKILLLLLCAWSIAAYTDITNQNCPAQFNVTTANITTSTAAASLGAFLYSGFQSPSSVARVQGIVIGGNTKDLNNYTSQMMVPYIIFGVIYLFFYLMIVVLCLFERSCPPCESIRRDLDSDPYSKRETRVTTIFILLFAAGIFIVCMIAMSFIPDIKAQSSMASCSIYLTLDTVLNGDGTWGGMVNLRDKVGNITNLLSAAVTQIQIYFPGDSWLLDSMHAMQTTNLNIYNTFKSSQLVTPNPDSTATAANAGQATPKIDSMFIKYGMGPNGTSNTMVNDIDIGLRTTKKVLVGLFSFPIKLMQLPNRQHSFRLPSATSSVTLRQVRTPS